MEGIEFENCRINKVENRIRNGLVRSVLHMSAAMNQSTARALGVYPLIYSADGVLKFGFNQIALAYEIDEAFRLFLAVAGLEQFALDLQGDGADSFKVVKKKERAGITFKVITLSNPHEILDWQIRHGEGFGFCGLSPVTVQAELPIEEKPFDAKMAAAGDIDEEEPEDSTQEPKEQNPAGEVQDGTEIAAAPDGAGEVPPSQRAPRDAPPKPFRDNVDNVLRQIERGMSEGGPPPPPI